MSAVSPCPDCGAPIPVGSPFGACPACLVQSAVLGDDDQDLILPRGDHPAPGPPSATDPGQSAPTRLGPYRLIRKLGEGGFGEVFEAEQDHPVRRRVALKLIKRGMDTRQVVARFEAERQALALMDHPYVAKVFDAGQSPDGRPFFVMELVAGQPITDFCQDHHLTLRQRLDLFIAVCEGVHHAHSKGIIHRDLKPGNVLVAMVDHKPLPKVIDFGVAKATEQILTPKTIFTELGKFIGTPAYMSPEQASSRASEVDTKSDIYSLGTLLYEVLTGHTPFDPDRLRRAGSGEMERILCEEDPAKPSTRLDSTPAGRKSASALRGDLDWIVMRALEKSPDRRYDTAIGFAKDLRRFLNHEPVEAGPPSRLYLARKFARRNKAALATATALTLALLAGTTVSTWQAIRATHAEKDARNQAQRAREAEKLAREEAQVGDTLAAFFTQDVVVAAFQGGPPTLAKLLAAMNEAESRLARLTDRPLVQAGGYLLLARLYTGWNMSDRAIQYARSSHALYSQQFSPTHEKTLEAAAVLLRLLLAQEQLAEADALLTASLPPAEARHGPSHPRVRALLEIQELLLAQRGQLAERLPVLRKLVAANPSEHAGWARLSAAHRALAVTALRDRRETEAVDHILCATALMLFHNWKGGFWQERPVSAKPQRRALSDAGLIPTEWIDSAALLAAQDPHDLLNKLQLPAPASLLVHASILEGRGDLPGALQLLARFLDEAPASHLVRHAYGLKLEAADQETEALGQLHRALLDAARQNDTARVRWFAANWNRLRTKLGLPLHARQLPLSNPAVDPESGHYYARLEIPLPWHDANRACRELGGHLAILDSPDEDDFLFRSFATDHICWLGASDHEREGKWRWVDGTPMDQSRWGRNQPSGDQPDENYLAFGAQPSFSILGRTYSWKLSGWYDHPGVGTLTSSFDENPMGNVLVTYALCEWDSQEAWQSATKNE